METDTTSSKSPAAQASEPTVIKFGPQAGAQTDFLSSEADIVIYGGARGGGKTYGLELDAMRYTQTPDYGAVIFRRTEADVRKEGGLWDTSERIYPYAGAESSAMTWQFPSGATVSFAGLEHEKSKIAWLGTQIPYLGFDQLEEFTASQFWYMLGCNRSPCGIPPCVRATANPEPGWLADLIAWWLDKNGEYPDMSKSGIVRWFVRIKDRTFWADTKQALFERFKDEPDLAPKSLTFIPAFVDDNPALLEADPTYKGNLQAQGEVEKERWLKGNWKVKMSAGMLLKREWFSKVIEKPEPRYERIMRYWDFAATGEQNPNFDQACYTSGTLLGLKGGVWDILDIRRERKDPPGVEDLVRTTAAQDGRHVQVKMEREGGSAGPWVVSHLSRNVLVGYDFAEGKEKWHKKDKITRAGFLASAAKNGNVRLLYLNGVKPEWVENFLTDCDNAPDGWMDDIDSTSGEIIEMGGVGAQHNPPQRVANVEAKSSGFDMPVSRRRGVTI